MDIPKLNGNNTDKIKIIPVKSDDLANPQTSQTDIPQSENEKSPSEIFPNSETANAEDLENSQNQSALNNGNSPRIPEILQFAQAYNQILVETVIPELEPFDKERRFKLKLAMTASFFFTIAGIALLCLVHEKSGAELAGLSFSMAVGVWEAIKKKFEKKLKKLVMPKLMKAFPGFYWQTSQTIETQEINSIRIFANSINSEKTYDDAFCGKFSDVDIDITECSFSTSGKHKIKIFKGAIIRLRMNKNFQGITIVRPKNSYMNCSDLKRLNLEEVKLEDIEFCKTYRVFSTDQIEARYLLTTSFMERFKNMNFSFFAPNAYCVFCGKFVYIAPSTDLDLFNLFSLKTPVTERKPFDIMFNQIYSILQLIEHFKLNQKMGL